MPTVVVGRHGHSARYDTVVGDDIAGAELVVNHLADLGHRRIAHIDHFETDPERLAEMPNAIRADGYRQAMRARGLADEIDVIATSYTQEGGCRGAREPLARPVLPTAIFAGADIAAMGVLHTLAEAGLAVPADISVAGYDNTTFAALGLISLTSSPPPSSRATAPLPRRPDTQRKPTHDASSFTSPTTTSALERGHRR